MSGKISVDMGNTSEALVIIDMQNDFLPGGSLGVPGGDDIIPYINDLQSEFDWIIASQDWHPHDHLSFASQHTGKNPFEEVEWDGLLQKLWPDHCIQGSFGAEFSSALKTGSIRAIFRKGMNRRIDSYSCFYDNGHLETTGMSHYLRGLGIEKLYFTGLAADFCVYFSAMDAIKEGFQTYFIENGTRYISEEGYLKAKKQMIERGIKIISDF